MCTAAIFFTVLDAIYPRSNLLVQDQLDQQRNYLHTALLRCHIASVVAFRQGTDKERLPLLFSKRTSPLHW